MKYPSSRAQFIRQKRYLDHSIQGWMIVIMMFFQIAFVIAGIVIFYITFSQLIEQHLYSIHKLDMATINHELRMLATKIVVAYLGINLLGLFVAHFIWVSFITRVLSEFNRLVDKTKSFNLSADNQPSAHVVVEAAKNWREKERKRWASVKSRVESLPFDQQTLIEDKEQSLTVLQDILHILKQKNSI